jgi:hypothetical protein
MVPVYSLSCHVQGHLIAMYYSFCHDEMMIDWLPLPHEIVEMANDYYVFYLLHSPEFWK